MPKKSCQVNNLILIYTGNGKGKTSAGLGLATRALRDKMKVVLIQFIKSASGSGEVGLKKILPKLEVKCFGKGFVSLKHENIKTLKQNQTNATAGLKFTEQAIKLGKYQVIILDEIFVAYDLGLVKLNDIIKLIKQARLARGKMFLVLTGRGCPKELYKLVDLVTEMKEIKHPFQQGINAVKGIDY